MVEIKKVNGLKFETLTYFHRTAQLLEFMEFLLYQINAFLVSEIPVYMLVKRCYKENRDSFIS